MTGEGTRNVEQPPAGVESLLVYHEGVRLKPYDDATSQPLLKGATLQGFLTIGVGRNLTSRGILPNESALLLQHDIADHWSELVTFLPWVERLDRVRQMVFLDMAFNMGVPKFLTFKHTLSYAKDGDFDKASIAMLQSPWAEQVGARALRLADMMRSGKLPSDVKGLQ